MLADTGPKTRPLRIAQVSPLFESVPPRGYGGTERVVSYLTEELVQLGHEVTLFASGDSVTSAELVPGCPHGLRLDRRCTDSLAHHVVMLEQVYRESERFDIIHFHVDYLHFPLSRRHHRPHVTTLHSRLDLPDLQPVYEEFPDMPVVSVSQAQRTPLRQAKWQGTVHHGLPLDRHTFREEGGNYLAFLGRVSPEKGLDRAIAIALEAGLPLKVAAKVDANDRVYFREYIKPLLEQSRSFVEFLGEIGGRTKDEFLGRAAAVLFPIDWPEPFGLVVIEAMACGTPVIAFPRGSVPEVIDHGATGFIVDDEDGAVGAVARLDELSRARCRATFEQRFNARRMAEDYVRIYHRVIANYPEVRRTVRAVPSVALGW
jgi:glycosyltransferase involved in cell wall biosynthesis